MNFVLILFSLIPISLILMYIYKEDIVEKEPIKLLSILFIGGIIALFLTKYLASKYQQFIPFLIEENPNLESYKIFLISFGEIGLIEEASKWLILNIIAWKSKNFNYIYDAIVYSVFISLGFATIENFFYLQQVDLSTVLIRSLFTVPAHASFGIIMGYYFGYAKYYAKRKYTYNCFKMFYSSVFFAVLYHGIYDFLLAFDNNYYIYIFFVFVAFIYINAILKLKKVNKLELSWE